MLTMLLVCLSQKQTLDFCTRLPNMRISLAIPPVRGYHYGHYEWGSSLSISLTGEREDDASPCIGVCSTGLGDEVCRGCGRTFDEVNNWHSLSKEQKIVINKRIKKEHHRPD